MDLGGKLRIRKFFDSIVHRIALYVKGTCAFFRLFVEISNDTPDIIKGYNYVSSFRI